MKAEQYLNKFVSKMANANSRRRGKVSQQNGGSVAKKEEGEAKGRSGNEKNNKNKKRKGQRMYDPESTHMQMVIKNILLASLISMTLIVGSVLIVGGQSFRLSIDASTPPTPPMNEKTKIQPLNKMTKAKEYDIISDESNSWNPSNSNLQRINKFLTDFVCNYTDRGRDYEVSQSGFCHPLLNAVPQRRTHNVAPTESNHTIGFHEVVLSLPRDLLIWDLDAMRDKFVRNELFSARHESTGNALDGGAFLAAYLVRKMKLSRGQWDPLSESDLDEIENARFAEYLDILPTFQELEKTHPTLWTVPELEKYLGRLTLSFILIMEYKKMMMSEYDAFCKASEQFKENVIVQEYIAMRVNVNSRAFGPGVPGPEEEIVGIHGVKTLNEEIQLYKDETGVDFNKGCRAMSPILDMWDHHAKPNVEWRYDTKKRAFVVFGADKKGIAPMQDIMVSYGTYTDTHLFAKFGFNNGDGSGRTEGSIAIMHPMLDLGLQSYTNLINRDGKLAPSKQDKQAQRETMVNYLRYDDGYAECISKEGNPKGFKLKMLKLKHLERIANKYDRWAFNISPRNVNSYPSISSDIPITTEAPVFDPRTVKFNGSRIIATCRLMALNVDDFEGNAIEVLEKALETDEEFIVKKQSDALEFRSLTVLSRLVTGALSRYPSTVKKDLKSLSSSAIPFQSKEWTAVHTRLGEMQSLEAVRSIATSGLKRFNAKAVQQLSPSHPSLNIHRTACHPDGSLVKFLSEGSDEL